MLNFGAMTLGLRIVENDMLVKTSEDWSDVRSPGRARRRRAKHRQNIRIVGVPADPIQIGDTIFMHPATMASLRAEMTRRSDQMLKAAFMGRPF